MPEVWRRAELHLLELEFSELHMQWGGVGLSWAALGDSKKEMKMGEGAEGGVVRGSRMLEVLIGGV